MPNILDTLPLLSFVLTMAIAIGGFVAFRGHYGQTASETQERVISALQAQNEVQARQITTLEKEVSHLNGAFAAIRIALKRRKLRFEIEGESIILIDESGKNESVTRITTHEQRSNAGEEGD